MTGAQPTKRPSLSVQTFWLLSANTAGFLFSVIFPLVLVRLLPMGRSTAATSRFSWPPTPDRSFWEWDSG